MDDLPFKVEYAKSSRASCRGCSSIMSKDCLRIGKMVQSPHFDGRIPQWYHFHCFFGRSRPKSTSDIAGFSALRSGDQQKIKAKIGGGGGHGEEATSSSCGGPVQVEYAKSNRSTCRSCEEKIAKGEVRIGRVEEAEDGAADDGRRYPAPAVRWFHVECFSEETAGTGIKATSFDRIGDLKKSDQDRLKEKFKGEGGGRVKKAKAVKESEEEKEMREQTDIVWHITDALKGEFDKAVMMQMMEANGQTVLNSGESALLSHVSDGMAFGALKRCPECSSGQLRYKSDGYCCSGNITEWTKCVFVTRDPARANWIIPKQIKDCSAYLKGFKFKKRKRVFPAAIQPTSPCFQPAKKKAKIEKPLDGMKVAIIGRLSKSKAALKNEVESLGGSVSTSVSSRLVFCISSEAEVEKESKKIRDAEEADVPIVSVDFLEDAARGGALLKIPQYNLVSWGLNRKEEDETDGGAKVVKMTIKGGGAVDPESGLEDSCHVFEEDGDLYAVTLGLVDVIRGTNSYYKLQLLQSDNRCRWYIFRSWGRVGTTIGSNKLDHYGSKADAVSQFKLVYNEKTGNLWEDRKNFKKKPGRFYPIDVDYGEEEESLKSSVAAGSQSKLPQPVQEIIKMIFDIDVMKKALVEFEIDLKKMPLGKLSKRQIEEAYSVLSEVQRVISSDKNPSRILDCSNRFYTLIPHDFGMQKPPLLDNEALVAAKTRMLDSLLDIEVAYSLLKSKSDSVASKDPIDTNYEKLQTDMKVLDHDSEEFKMLVEYVANTHAATHRGYELEVQEILKINRHGEEKRYKPFKKLHNRMLLWHGSRVTNYAGILSQGLRIAPPEAPVSGYMFGKGVYFADMVSKSANYCNTSSSAPVGMLLLCEVALGEMYERQHADHITKLPKGKNSTKGVGSTFPDPSGSHVLDDGVVIPMGKGTSGLGGGSLLYNEYIVYDVAQIRMKYLFKMNFNHKRFF
eukprot:m.309715 g.309715  ORF g.309715 m.309715 type:complete len:959 (+) comp47446_c0_seq1:38-2914(+)